MIPKKLTLKNFLSYREAILDFSGLHTACICGANGAGKSSLLEAITWGIWGQTRTTTDEDVIHIGEKNVRVDFEFTYNYQNYKVIRTRQRGGSSTLDFQIENNGNFKSLSGKGIRETQKVIIDCLKLDYETFINSAYLRQGKADEFMMRTPSQRKEILGELLKLNQYEKLANKAKDKAKEAKGKIEELESKLKEIETKLEDKNAIISELDNVKKQLKILQVSQKQEEENLQTLRIIANQRRLKEQELQIQQNQFNNLLKKSQEITGEIQVVRNEVDSLQNVINDRENIILGYQELQKLQQAEINLREKFQLYQEALQQKRNLEQELRKESNDLTLTIQGEKNTLKSLEKRENELVVIIQDKDKIDADLQQLYQYRQRLNELDEIQHEVAPLQQRRLNLQTEIEKEKAKLNAELEQLQKEEIRCNRDLVEVPRKQQKLANLKSQIEELNNKKNYAERVKEKGLEKKSLQEKYEQNKLNLDQQLDKLEKKLNTLSEDAAICPLCEQELGDNHLNYVMEKTLQEKQQIQAESWQYEQEIACLNRELKELRNEYSDLSKEISAYDILKENSVKLEEQLIASEQISLNLQNIIQEKNRLENKIESANYAQEIRDELQLLEQAIVNLNYDEKTHSLVRKEEQRWRKAEYQKAKLDDAEKEFKQIQQQKPIISQQIDTLEITLQELSNFSPIQLQINEKQLYLEQLNYDDQEHDILKNALQNTQIYQSKYIELQQAEKQLPSGELKLSKLTQDFASCEQEIFLSEENLDNIKKEINELKDCSEEIENLEKICEKRREEIDNFLTKKGGLEQSITNLDKLQSEYETTFNRLREEGKNYRVYNELGSAFGKNGIQSLMIENILPEIEAEANQILARLTANQLHVQFLTQKPKSSRSKKSTNDNDFKDTLEIIISDAKGTRSYETYSGGEAFRINFSIRLALARILVQNSGSSLQFLIVDEGFGTQDAEGCDRLIASLNAIANDFTCILVITHISQFKEAFQNHIEVYKTNQGSKLSLSN